MAIEVIDRLTSGAARVEDASPFGERAYDQISFLLHATEALSPQHTWPALDFDGIRETFGPYDKAVVWVQSRLGLQPYHHGQIGASFAWDWQVAKLLSTARRRMSWWHRRLQDCETWLAEHKGMYPHLTSVAGQALLVLFGGVLGFLASLLVGGM